MQILEPNPNAQSQAPLSTFFSLGFRPFFAAGALSGAVLMICWVLIYRGIINPPLLSVIGWHAHEMIFGYGLAIIAGFLLTAVRNWTGLQTASGRPLVFLLLLWALPRVLPFWLGQPAWLAILDLCFPLCLALALGLPIVRSKNWRNLMFIPILLGFFACNLGFYLSLYQLIDISSHAFLLFTLELIMTIIAIIGSRVVPMFTRNGTNSAVQPRLPAFTGPLIMTAALLQLFSNFIATPEISAGLSIAFGLVLLWFIARCHGTAVWTKPLLWVLHIGYCAVGLGFLLKAASKFQLVPESLYLHTFGVLAMGMMTLGFIGRVSLGHTGRALLCSKTMTLSYILMAIAGAVRVYAAYAPKIMFWDIAATCWSLALLLFFAKFLPMLLSPRADGQAG